MTAFANVGFTMLTAAGSGWLAQTCIDSWVGSKNSFRPWDETKWSEITQRIRFLERKFNPGSQVELWEQTARNLNASRDFLRHKDIIFINPQYFLAMTADEQEFVIAHEFSHIKRAAEMQRLVTYAVLAASVIPSIVLPIVFPGFVVSLPTCYMVASTILSWLYRCIANSILSWLEEQSADHEAFTLCGEKGGISLFTKESSREPNMTWYRWAFIFLLGHLDHPPTQNRISYLQKWAQERDDRIRQQALSLPAT